MFQQRPKTAEEWENEAAAGNKPARLDRNAPPKRGLHLRVNDYELAELERIAKLEDCSIQRLMRRALRNLIKSAKRTAKTVP